jgi:hypothetical protein
MTRAAAHRRCLIDQAHRADSFARAVLRAARGEREVIRREIKLHHHRKGQDGAELHTTVTSYSLIKTGATLICGATT